MTEATDDTRVMAISQIIYEQYHIWDIYVLGLKTKVFVGKTTKSLFPWTREPQWQNSADSLAENTLNALRIYQPNLSAQAQKFGYY